MKKKQAILIVVFFAVFVFTGNAQKSNTLCGEVLDKSTGKPLAFVNISVENTLTGTATDENGSFCIKTDNITAGSITLRVSRIGFDKKNVKISSATNNKITIYLIPSPINISELVIFANKNVSSSREQTVISNVISKDAILESGVQNIPEILQKQPGVSLAGQAYHAAPSIRGLARKRVIMLLDGEKVSSERNVGAPGTFINPFEISRIEILKGPYSTLYGSDATGGVVNIISKSYEQSYYSDVIGGHLDMSYQSVSNGKNVNLALNGKVNKILYHINAGYRNADNYKTPGGNGLMNTFFEEKHVGGKVIYNINKNNQLTLKSYYSKGGPIGKPAYDTLTNAIHNYDNHFITGINYKIKNIGKYLTKAELNITQHNHDLGVVIEKHKLEANPDDDKLINNQKSLSGTDYIAQYDMYFSLNEKFKIVAGYDGYFRKNIDVSEEKIVKNYNSGVFMMAKSDTLLADASQNSHGIFAQANCLLSEKIFLNGGIRWNYIKTKQPKQTEKNRENNAFSGNFGLSYFPVKNFNIKANAGRAFRMPDIKELYVTTRTPGGLNISNPDLIPEHSLNFDLAFVFKNKSNLTQLSLFHNQIKNMIILDWNNSTANREGKFKNIGKGLLYGAEFSISQKITKSFSAYLNLTQIYGFDVVADDEIMDVPPLQLNSGIKYSYKNKLNFQVSERYSAQQNNVAEDDFINDEFLTFDFFSQWKILKNLNTNFSITNILNRTYREHYNFNWMYAPGRSFNLGVNFNF